MADYPVRQWTQWIENYLADYGWPPPRSGYSFLAKLATHVGQASVEYYDCEVAGDTATVVLFTSSHVFVQTVDCLWETQQFRNTVQVLRRSGLRALRSAAVEDVVVPPLARFCDWLARWTPWLAETCEWTFAWWARRSEIVAEWYYEEGPDAEVVIELRYADLQDRVLTLPMSDDGTAPGRLARFLPSLTENLG